MTTQLAAGAPRYDKGFAIYRESQAALVAINNRIHAFRAEGAA